MWSFPANGQGLDEVLARTGSSVITAEEYIKRFELSPQLSAYGKGNTRIQFLYSLIAEKLLSEEAKERGYDSSEVFVRAIRTVRGMIARDELYRREILANVLVPEEEIGTGVERARRERLISFAAFQREEDARFVRSMIPPGRDLARVDIDSSMECVRDTATLIWGDADPVMESVVYALRPQEISTVTRVRGSFYIIQMLRERPAGYFTSLPPSELRQFVEQTLRKRAERSLMDSLLDKLMSNVRASAKGDAFRILARGISKALDTQSSGAPHALTSTSIREVRTHCAGSLADTLVVIDTLVWTIGEVIGLLPGMDLRFEGSNVETVYRTLDVHLGAWIHQHVVSREALRRGLDTLGWNKLKLQVWSEGILAGFMKDEIRNVVGVSEAEVIRYLARSKDSVDIPQIRLVEIWTGTLISMQNAIDDLDSGISFDSAAARWSEKPDGENRFFPVTERWPLGELAWDMNVGERGGPLLVDGRYVIFEVREKRRGPSIPGPDFEKARNELLNMKKRRALDQFLAGVAREKGVSVFADRVRELPVSPIPMMAFRILGFGGRMVEFPFVESLFQWAGEDRISDPVP